MDQSIRQSGIGGSDAAVILGLSHWKSPVQLYYEKRGEIGLDPPNEAMHFGNLLEEVIAREYARRTGQKVARVNSTLRHPDHSWMMAHIDRRILNQADGMLLECKTAGKWWKASDWGESGTSDIPDYYMPQIQHYLAVTGWKSADLAALLAGNDFRIYSIERDDHYIKNLIASEADFWRRIQENDPPGPESEDDCRLLWADANGETAIASDEILEAFHTLHSVRERIKNDEATESALKIKIQEFMADNTFLIGPSGEKLATWKNQESIRLDTARIKSEAPDLYEKFGKKSVSRVFRIS